MKINPKVNMKIKARKTFEYCMVLSLLVHLGLFLAFKNFEGDELDFENVQKIIEVEDIPETEQIKRPPPPTAPALPVESEDEDLLEDITIDETDLVNFTQFSAPPPPPVAEEEIPDFLPLEDQPQIIGGLSAIQRKVVYPALAKKAGVEGLVQIKVLVSEEGVPIDFQVLRSLGSSGCDEASINAIKTVRFVPAKQRGRPVKFWMSIPIRFQLSKGGE